MVKNSSKLAPLKPCVHMYLYSHLRSGMKRIMPKDWATAMLLPVQQFVGAHAFLPLLFWMAMDVRLRPNALPCAWSRVSSTGPVVPWIRRPCPAYPGPDG